MEVCTCNPIMQIPFLHQIKKKKKGVERKNKILQVYRIMCKIALGISKHSFLFVCLEIFINGTYKFVNFTTIWINITHEAWLWPRATYCGVPKIFQSLNKLTYIFPLTKYISKNVLRKIISSAILLKSVRNKEKKLICLSIKLSTRFTQSYKSDSKSR